MTIYLKTLMEALPQVTRDWSVDDVSYLAESCSAERLQTLQQMVDISVAVEAVDTLVDRVTTLHPTRTIVRTLSGTDGSSYAGEVRNSKKHGKGSCTYFDGAVYEGQWCEDGKQGHGVMTFVDGDVYNGEWKDDKKHGRGVYTWGGIAKMSFVAVSAVER